MADVIHIPSSTYEFLPSLTEFASTKAAMLLLNRFDIQMLNNAFARIQLGCLTSSHEGGQEDRHGNFKNDKESILCIPVHLRSKVMKAVNGLHYAISEWRIRHSMILDTVDLKCLISWRSNGTINSIETAQQLVQHVNIGIIARFQIACVYCFEKNIKALWVKMRKTDRIKCIKRADKPIYRFWIQWLHGGCRVPWMQALLDFIDPREVFYNASPKYSTFFPFLKPETRVQFFGFLLYSTRDDMLCCLRLVTEKEKEQILKTNAIKFLLLQLEWPMQNRFLETLEKFHSCLIGVNFLIALLTILRYIETRLDYDYWELLDGLWERTPDRVKEIIKQVELSSSIFDSYLSKKERKRNADYDRKHLKDQKTVFQTQME